MSEKKRQTYRIPPPDGWQDEAPTAEGFHWFYGRRSGLMSVSHFHLVEVEPGPFGGCVHTILWPVSDHFREGAEGWWQQLPFPTFSDPTEQEVGELAQRFLAEIEAVQCSDSERLELLDAVIIECQQRLTELREMQFVEHADALVGEPTP